MAIPKDGGIGRAGLLRATGFLRATGLGGAGFLRATGLGGVGRLRTTGLGGATLGGTGFLLAAGLGVSTLGATALFLGVTGREGRRTFVRLLFVGVVRRVGALLTAFLALLRLPRIINT